MKKKVARRWLNRNSQKIAQLKIGSFTGHQRYFIKQYLRCLKEVKKNE